MPQVTAAPYPVMVNGAEFRMSPLRDVDIDELTNWVRSYIMSEARKSLAGIIDPDTRQETLQAALAISTTIAYGQPAANKYLMTRDGMLRVFYQSVRRNHRNLTYDQFVANFKSGEDVMEFFRVWEEINVPKKHQEASADSESGGGEELDQGADVRPDSSPLQVHTEPDRADDAVPANRAG